MKGCEVHSGGGGGGGAVVGGYSGVIVRSGYLKKLKTSRRKFFVLRAETAEASAKLEYYDTERKFTSGLPPKRSIPLKNCFNINKRSDIKQHKHVIALYTKDDCFCVVLDNEEEVDSWLKALLSLQHGEEAVDGETPKPTFEHIWQVTVLNRGLGTTGLTGTYRLCLTDKTLSLIKKDSEVPQIELNLPNIRSCGNLRDFFFLEIGRSSTLGPGELWMQTEDNNIAQNIHSTVFHAMSTNNIKEELGPKSRNRSSSATESSKPNTMNRKQIHTGISPKCLISQDLSQSTETHLLPSSSTTSQHPIVSGVASFYQHLIQRGSSKASERRHSISAGGVTTSGQISHQRTQSLPLANPAPLSDQNTTSHPLRVATNKRSNQSSKCLTGGRERCDSMPSRARTTSEGGNHSVHQFRTFLNPYRPSSIHGRDISHSPPSDSPVSPPSAGCSTDSGSSYSLPDDTDILCPEMDSALGRYSHSLTPDEAIAEEDCPDSPTGAFYPQDYLRMQPPSSDDGYVEMLPTTSVSSITSGTPSADIRFGEYQLEKVAALVAPSEDSCSDDSSRPMRAYSLGARPDCHKHYMEMNSCTPAASINNENLRVRALSVGSKTKKHARVLPPHYQPSHVGTKSSSAPILSNSRHNSDDFHVMDFSRNSSNNSSGYMRMKPGATPASSQLSGNKHFGYVHMQPGNVSPYVDMTPGASPAKSSSFLSENKENNTDYMIMDPRKNNINNNNNNSVGSDYLDMSFGGRNSSERTPSNSYQLSPVKTSCCVAGSPSNSLDMYFGSPKSLETLAATTPEGYVEMSVGKGHHQRQGSFDEETAGGGGRSKKKKSKDKCMTTRSQPITIQLPTSRNCQKMSSTAVTSSNSSSSPIYGIGRKFSTGTPPKMHLPLNSNDCHNSLPRQNRSRKNSSRRDSRDSSSSSITTPSSSSTIFPMSLNSPCSPPSSSAVSASTAAATIPVTIKVPPAVLNTVYKKPPSKTSNQNKCEFYQFSDYTPMDFDCGKSAKNQANNFEHSAVTTSAATLTSSNSSDYVNFNPAEGVAAAASSAGCYTLMSFGAPSNQIAALTLNDSSSFRPISEDVQSESPYELLRTRPTSRGGGGGGVTIGSRPSSTSSELCSSSGSTIIVGMLSRPESVNSDRIRPLSNNSSSLEQPQQLHYASLDLDNDGASSRSPRTVKNSTSAVGGTSNGGSSSGNNSSNSNENSQCVIENSLQYAAIDFVKSEGLKNHANSSSSNSSSGSNAKLKH